MKLKFRRLCAALAGAMLLTAFSGCGAAGTANDADAVKQLKKQYSNLVKLGDYKGVSYVAADTTVTDDDVQHELDYLVYQNTTTEQLTTGTATWGDAVNIDFVGYIGDTAFDGGNTQGMGTTITLGNSGYIDHFDEQIVGHKPGETFDVNVTFPDDYEENLAGQDARFETTLNYIQGEDIIPTVDDEFIKTATQDAYSTVDEYKQATKERLQQDKLDSALASDKHSVLQAVIDQTTIVEYPEKEIQDRIDQVTAMYEDYAASNGVDLDTLLSYYYGYDSSSFQDFLKDSIEQYIREKMVVVAIANAEGISCSDEEHNAKIQELLEESGFTDVSEMNAQYGYNDEDYYMLVLEDKVVDFLYENAVPGSPTDAEAETEAATEAE